jgi:hypothetical protein
VSGAEDFCTIAASLEAKPLEVYPHCALISAPPAISGRNTYSLDPSPVRGRSVGSASSLSGGPVEGLVGDQHMVIQSTRESHRHWLQDCLLRSEELKKSTKGTLRWRRTGQSVAVANFRAFRAVAGRTLTCILPLGIINGSERPPNPLFFCFLASMCALPFLNISFIRRQEREDAF